MDVGEVIRDYVLEIRIGAGGAGEVWRAHHRYIKKKVAIKVIYRNLSQDEQLRERVIREAAAMATLAHPYIVQLHEFFFLNDQPHLVMDYVAGGSLQSKIDDSNRLPVEEVLAISRDILSALNYAHTKGIIHRDVKPANILLGKRDGHDEHAFITDFGTALMLGKTRTTQYGKTVGTPEYMSPEQIKGGRMDHRTDVYSFGCVLYEMLTGHPPYGSRDKDALTDFAIMSKHLNNTAIPVRELNPAVDENTAAVVQQALQRDPKLRPAGCAEMAALLSAVKKRPEQPNVDVTPPEPKPAPPDAGLTPWWASKPAWVLIIAVFGVLIIFLFSQQRGVPPQIPGYTGIVEPEYAEDTNQRDIEQRRIEEERRQAAERAQRERQERLEEEQRKEAERKRRERLAEQRRLEERRRQNKIYEFALDGFYRKYRHLQGEDHKKTAYKEEWKKYLNCYGVVDYEFFQRHPELEERPIRPGEKALSDEWMTIKESVTACN